MRLGLDLRYVRDHFPGVGRYSYELARALAALPTADTLYLFVNPQQPTTRADLAALHRPPRVRLVPIAAPPRSLHEQVTLPRLAHRLRLDVLHTPYYVKPYLPMPCPTVVTLYDLTPLYVAGSVRPAARVLFTLLTALAVLRSDHIITLSRHAQHDLSRYVPRLPTRSTVIAAAPAATMHPPPAATVATVRARYHLPTSYVLWVGTNKPHKNLPALVAAWRTLRAAWHPHDGTPPPVLVLAGASDPRHPTAAQLTAGMGEQVRVLPTIPEGDLPALYAGATVFVFPSLYEGFGLPPLEAMACGTAVVCSNRASLPAVVGNAAWQIDPTDPAALAHAMHTLLTQPATRAALVARGTQHAAHSTWADAARATRAVYAAVAGDTGGTA